MFTHCLFHKVHSSLDTSKSPGPDQLHPMLLKWLALADLFNNSIATAVVPGDWKAAVICPIFKKWDPEVGRCQLPPSERTSKRVILSFLIQDKALTSCQHG